MNLTTNNLHPTDSFHGRQDEFEQLTEYVNEGIRCVTVIGPPGVGKSRLVQHWSAQFAGLQGEPGGEVLWCDLEWFRQTQKPAPWLALQLAKALDVALSTEEDDTSEANTKLLLAMRARHIQLVVLDNIGNTADACIALLEQARVEAPEILWICTSRAALLYTRERILEVSPLPSDEAVALFEARARRATGHFILDEQLTLQVQQLVTHLDGLPLAIELAAARARLLPPAEILKRISRRFSLLKTSDPSIPEQHKTLKNAIGWSWEQLDEQTQRALSELTLFSHDFSLDAAEAVLHESFQDDLLDIVDRLVQTSLLRTKPCSFFPGEVRLNLLESVRTYVQTHHAPEHLQERLRAHAIYYFEEGAQWSSDVRTQRAASAISRLRLERVHMEQALETFAEEGKEGDTERALRVGLYLEDLFSCVGGPQVYTELFEKLDVLVQSCTDQELLATFLTRRIRWSHTRGKMKRAQKDVDVLLVLSETYAVVAPSARLLQAELSREQNKLEDALSHLEDAPKTQDALIQRMTLAEQGRILVDLHRSDEASRVMEELKRVEESTDLRGECEVLRRMAYVSYYLRRPHDQLEAHQSALDHATLVGDERRVAWSLQGIAEGLYALGDWKSASETYPRAIEQHQRLGNRYSEGICWGNLGAVLHRLDRWQEAERAYKRGLDLHRTLDAVLYKGIVLHGMAALYHERSHESGHETFGTALRFYDQAQQHMRDHDMRVDLGGVLLCRGWMLYEHHQYERAQQDFLEADALFEATDCPSWAVLARQSQDIAGGHKELSAFADETQPVGTVDVVSQALGIAWSLRRGVSYEQLSSRVEELAKKPGVRGTLYGRLSSRLSRLLPRVHVGEEDESEVEQSDMRLASDAKWFITREMQEPIDVRRRKSIRLILDALVTKYEEEPGTSLDVYVLFDVGWPGQDIDPELAAERVYWAIRTLRNLGLRDLLLTEDDGYLMDANISIIRETEPEEQ